MYAAIEYAPSIDLRKQAIDNIKEPSIFRSVTQLCDAADWDESAHLGAKYLRVMRNAIKLNYSQVCEENDKIMHYELLAIVIQKCLKKIIDKMKKDIQLLDGDTVTAFEITLTFFVLVRQANNFNFSNLDIVKTYQMRNPENKELVNNMIGAYVKDGFSKFKPKTPGLTPTPDGRAKREGSPKHVCEYEEVHDPEAYKER